MKIRRARKDDLAELIGLLVNDKLGIHRESAIADDRIRYESAFDKISGEDDQLLLVAENDDGEILGMMQLSFIQYLTYMGGLRAQAESVFVKESERGKGTGSMLMNEAIRIAKERGAHLMQLTTDKQRPEAVKFYERLGFISSHEGMKLHFKEL